MERTVLMSALRQDAAARGAVVDIRAVSKNYGQIRAVADVTMRVEAGEFLAVLGPSGSGKTTLLMMLAGFESPGCGRLFLDGRDITDLPPNRRNIAMVFQKYALFPHKSVGDNIAFPLRMRGMGKAEREERVRKALDVVRLSEFGERMPAQLSGGQQQRVALARAMVFEPPVILMDEPLGALDKKLRQQMQIEIKELQGRIASTMIYVTHDQEEALTMSNRIAVMDRGRVLQVDTPEDLYSRPATAFVASFVGEMNFAPVRLIGSDVSRWRIAFPSGAECSVPRNGESFSPGTVATLAVRPEDLTLQRMPDGPGFPGMVVQAVYSGATTTLRLQLDGQIVWRAVSFSNEGATPLQGERVTLMLREGAGRLYPAEAASTNSGIDPATGLGCGASPT